MVVRDAQEKWRNELLTASRYSSIKDLHQVWHKEIAEGNTASELFKGIVVKMNIEILVSNHQLKNTVSYDH